METAVSAPHVAKQLGEEVAEIGLFPGRVAPTGELEAGVPVRRRTELLAGLMASSQLVVRGALFRVGEYGISLVELLHAQFGIGLLGNVGMELARELAECLLDVLRGGIARHSQRSVVVLEFHACSPFPVSSAALPLGSMMANISLIKNLKSSGEALPFQPGTSEYGARARANGGKHDVSIPVSP